MSYPLYKRYFKAKKLGVPILSETFVTECIKAGKIVAASQEQAFDIEFASVITLGD